MNKPINSDATRVGMKKLKPLNRSANSAGRPSSSPQCPKDVKARDQRPLDEGHPVQEREDQGDQQVVAKVVITTCQPADSHRPDWAWTPTGGIQVEGALALNAPRSTDGWPAIGRTARPHRPVPRNGRLDMCGIYH